MKISTLISGKKVATISPNASIQELVAELASHKVGALVVSTDSISVEGIVSERDVVRAMPGKISELNNLHVRDLMSVNVISCDSNSTVADVLNIMTENRVRHIPVTENGKMVSIVSIGDLVKAHITEIDSERSALRDYITH